MNHKITIQEIVSGSLISKLPELYCLDKIIEYNDVHLNDSVLSHTIKVAKNVIHLTDSFKGGLKGYFEETIDDAEKKYLLFIAALCHDLGKYDTFSQAGPFTECNGHEIVSAEKTVDLMTKFDFTDDQINYVHKIVNLHDDIYSIVDKEGKIITLEYKKFKRVYPQVIKELIILMISDIMGSQLWIGNPQKMANTLFDVTSKIEVWEKS